MSIPIILQQLFKHQFSIFLHSWISIRYPIEEEKKKYSTEYSISVEIS